MSNFYEIYPSTVLDEHSLRSGRKNSSLSGETVFFCFAVEARITRIAQIHMKLVLRLRSKSTHSAQREKIYMTTKIILQHSLPNLKTNLTRATILKLQEDCCNSSSHIMCRW